MYLRFANPQVADEKAMLIYGISTTRESDDTKSIGKFGSGAKHAVALCLREELQPKIYLSNLCMEFSAQPIVVDGYTYNQVHVHYSGKDEDGKTRNSSRSLDYVIEHGQDDWTGLYMALREFSSNAIDGAIRAGSWEKAIIELVPDNKVRAKTGWTQVFVPVSLEVQKWMMEMPKRFLHFSEPDSLGSTAMLPKKDRNLVYRNRGPVVYRRGVLVRELETLPSLFDYQLEELEIDESRNCDEYKVRAACARALADAPPEVLRTIFLALAKGELYWEFDLDSYYLLPTNSDDAETIKKRKLNWQLAWSEVCGDAVAASALTADRVSKKGRTPILISSQPLLSAIRRYDVPCDFGLMDKNEQKGIDIFDATSDAVSAVNLVWEKIVGVGMNFGKAQPKVKCFRKLTDGGAMLLGYQEGDTVYINIDIATGGRCYELYNTAFEELGHYVSGATDFTRDFQNFLVSVAARLMVKSN